MSDELDLNVSELRRRRVEEGRSNHHQNGFRSGPRGQPRAGGGGGTYWLESPAEFQSAPAPLNLWRLVEVLLRRWAWLGLAALICGGIAFLLGLKVTGYTASVSLLRRENPNAFSIGASEAAHAYISRELSAQTLFGLMRSPEVFRRASAKANPPVRAEKLAQIVKVIPERNPDFVTLAVTGKEPREVLASWANLVADEAVEYTRELQASEAGSISEFLGMKLHGVQLELAQASQELVRFSEQAQSLDVDKEVEAYTAQVIAVDTRVDSARIDRDTIDLRIQHYKRALAEQSPGNDRLQQAQDQLESLRAKGYTDLHPDVVRQKAVLDGFEKQGAPGPASAVETRLRGGTLAGAIQMQILELEALKQVRDRELEEYGQVKERMQDKARRLSKTVVEYAQLKAGQKRLEDLRVTLLTKQQEAQLLRDNALGYFKVFSYASPEQVTGTKRFFAVGLLSVVGALLGLLAAAGLVLIAEAMDSRIKTASDVERITGLPMLAALGDLRKMTPEQQITWAFRTLTILQGKLNESSDQTLVCGFISSGHGEGRSTWVNLLVSAASQRGMRVLTVATRHSSAQEETGGHTPPDNNLLPVGPATTLTKNVLAFPAQVTEQFNNPQAQPIVHIPLPGWVWNLERRQQWRTALDHWEGIQNLVLLIELPPASQPESVLLAEHLPQVIWLAGSGMAHVEETRAQLETLRHARVNLVGAVLNREPCSFVRKHFSRWMGRLSALLVGATLGVPAPTAAEAPTEEPASATAPASLAFSITAPVKRAPWQERLTLGPGDAVDISIYGRPELTRTNVVIGPDGRFNYLHIQDFPASGLTIDELRARFDDELAKYYVTPRTIILPASYNSKKYYVLGKVVNEGVFVLDRPLTIIEAVARARGLQTGMLDRNTTEIADLSRSFLVRQGRKIPVDLEKLFREGDLSQNIPIEPNDYLYFAPSGVHEIFILGEVLSPGIFAVTSQTSLLAALSARGGFTDRAWRKRVLVVRGSIQKPEAFAIDAPAILAGRTPDFKLQPRDIVYVNARPWIRIEELLDIAIQSFIEASVTAWSGHNLGPVIGKPIFPRL